MFSKTNEAIIAIVTCFQSEDGQAMAEYGLILAFIAAVCIAALTAIGLGISGSLNSFTSLLGGGS